MLDATTIAAGLLHDCVEDIEEITIETIEKDFGAEVAVLVDGVTKLSRLNFSTKEEQKIESLRKMFLAMAKDIRVVIIKLADRLHNMRTLKFQPADRQIAIAHETLDIYAPLAHRLGMNAIKWELEDLSLRYIDPEGYYTLVNLVGMKRQEREAAIRGVIETLQTELKNAGIKAEVEGRPKHFYSIYNKMKNQHKTFDQIHDLIAIRVLVNTKQECYSVLGIVHTLWSLVPGRFKDYISIAQGEHVPIAAHHGGGQGRHAFSRCRSARTICTKPPNTASPRTGAIKRAGRRTIWIKGSPGCAAFSIGRTPRATRANSANC